MGGRRLIGPQGRRLPEPCRPRTRQSGTRPYKVPQMERTQFCRYTVPREAERACLMDGGDPPYLGNAPCALRLHRGPHLYFSRSRQKLQGENKKVFQSGKSPNRRLSVTGSPPQYHRPPVCALPPPRPKYGIKYVITKRAGPSSLEKQGKDGPVVELRGTPPTVQKRINRRGGGISKQE